MLLLERKRQIASVRTTIWVTNWLESFHDTFAAFLCEVKARITTPSSQRAAPKFWTPRAATNHQLLSCLSEGMLYDFSENTRLAAWEGFTTFSRRNTSSFTYYPWGFCVELQYKSLLNMFSGFRNRTCGMSDKLSQCAFSLYTSSQKCIKFNKPLSKLYLN
jgi:hypothetical protein